MSYLAPLLFRTSMLLLAHFIKSYARQFIISTDWVAVFIRKLVRRIGLEVFRRDHARKAMGSKSTFTGYPILQVSRF